MSGAPRTNERGSELVSIVIPARNASLWIAESVTSACAQTHRPIEIIVVDNDSSDDTVARALRAGGNAVRVVVERVAGPSAARNAGIAESRGEFIQFLDADDALLRDKVARQVQLLRETGADVAWGDFVRPHDDGRPLADHTEPVVSPRLTDDVEASLLNPDGFVHLGATLLRRSAVAALRFDTSVYVVEDVRFLYGIAATGARFVSSGNSGYIMREHEHAARASRVDRSAFWSACGDLAVHAESRWRATGTLTASRIATLVRIQVAVARHCASQNPRRARAAIARAEALTPDYLTEFPGRMRSLVRLLGLERAERIAAAAREVRRMWRG